MSLSRRLGAVLLVAGILATVTFAISGVALRTVLVDQGKVTDLYFTAVLRANEHLLAQVDQETGVRGFELSGDPAYLEPFQSGVTAENTTYFQLRDLLTDEPEALTRLEESRVAAEQWRAQYAVPRIELVRSEGRIPFSRAELEQGRERFDRVRAAASSLIGAILSLRDRAVQELRSATHLLVLLFSLAAVATLLSGLLLWLSLRRWVTRPVRSLAQRVSSVQDGNWERPIEPVGPLEIASLAADVDGMRQRVVTQYAAAVAARAEAEAASQVVRDQAEELRRSNRDLEQFAYVASHDLQEPLRKVSSFCQMLERRYKGQLDERADQYIAFAVDGAKRMQVLINDLLTFSRVGRNTAGFAEVQLQDCFDRACEVLEGRLSEAGASVTTEPLPAVWGEASLLTQLFQNLIGNAVKFRGEQAPVVHLTVRQVPGEQGRPGSFEFTCRDNGIGIDAQYADKIFVIFQRLHAKEEYSGTGIGLALCKKIVEYHGGRIWLHTEPREGTSGSGAAGTTFVWTLPVPAEPDDRPESPQSPATSIPPISGEAQATSPSSELGASA